MTDRPADEQRERLIAGDRAGALEPDEAADVPLLADLLADPSTWVEPSPGLEDAIVDAVVNAAPDSTRSARTATLSPRRWAPSRMARFALAAAAAILIVIAVGATLATRGGTGPDYTAELAATELIPGAHGSVDITQNDGGFRIALDASGLPPLPAGEFYEAWLKSDEGTLVPIGTFSSSDDRVTFWSGVSPRDFPTLTVTMESTDNEQTSSGRVVLAGEVDPVP